MWYQIINPLNNIGTSAIAASIPIFFLFFLLLSRKISGHIVALLTLFISIIVATLVFTMPLNLALMSAFYGVLNGMFPIGWIVLNAIFLYNISVNSGGFAIVRDGIKSITADRRIQALLIAFCFGAFLEGAAGFGAPVAITAGMLVGIGFEPLYAAGICLIANTAPVAFGGIGIAVITAGHLSNIDPIILSKMISHQLPFIAFIMPLWLVLIISGWKGAKEIWPAIFVTGASYSLTMFFVASFLGPALPDIMAAIVSIASLMILLEFWQPKEVWLFPNERTKNKETFIKKKHNLNELVRAWTPFLLLIIFITNWGNSIIQKILNSVTIHLPFGILDQAVINNKNIPLTANYTFAWLGAAGTAIFITTIVTSIIVGVKWKMFFETVVQTIKELIKPLITIGSVVGFAYVANFSGMSASIGSALTITGPLFPFLSPLLGWIGVFITGSDTSSNALFSNIQSQTAHSLGVNPVLSVAANSTGGVAAKMISPQSIAVATASTNLTGQEGKLFRFTILHSIGLILIISLITCVQNYYAKWMIPLESEAIKITESTNFGNGEYIILIVSIMMIIFLSIISIKHRFNKFKSRKISL